VLFVVLMEGARQRYLRRIRAATPPSLSAADTALPTPGSVMAEEA